MTKNQLEEIEQENDAPTERTEWDRHFTLVVDELKSIFDIRSDRAMCRHLGIHENLISRIRTGVQSVPATVWDIVNAKMKTPEYKAIFAKSKIRLTSTSRFPSSTPISDSLATNPFIRDTEPQPVNQPSLQTECAKDLEVANEIIALLTKQLANKQRTIQMLLEQKKQMNQE